jgi:hypothetical protein
MENLLGFANYLVQLINLSIPFSALSLPPDFAGQIARG